MKNLKFSFLSIFALVLFSIPSFAQEKVDTTMMVNGVCEMCQFTIESSTKKVEGVKTVNWDVESKVLTVSYDPAHTNLAAISDAINASGYDTEYNTAPDEAYYGLHKCCYYRDPQVVEDHKKD